MAILVIKWEPVEGHGAGYGQLEQAPEVNPDSLIVHNNIYNLIMKPRSMISSRHFLVRYGYFRYPDVVQDVGISEG